jgi:hypothetical protein
MRLLKDTVKKTKNTEVSTRRDSEVKKQITQFLIGGKQFRFVQMLSENWFIPMIINYAKQGVVGYDRTKFDPILDRYRPLGYEQNIMLSEHLAKLKSYVA